MDQENLIIRVANQVVAHKSRRRNQLVGIQQMQTPTERRQNNQMNHKKEKIEVQKWANILEQMVYVG